MGFCFLFVFLKGLKSVVYKLFEFQNYTCVQSQENGLCSIIKRLLHDWRGLNRASDQLSLKPWWYGRSVQHHLKIRHQAAKKGVKASLTELTHSFSEHVSLLKLIAMCKLEEGVWCRGMSVMPYIAEPTCFSAVCESRAFETDRSHVQAGRWKQTYACSPGWCQTEWIAF